MNARSPRPTIRASLPFNGRLTIVAPHRCASSSPSISSGHRTRRSSRRHAASSRGPGKGSLLVVEVAERGQVYEPGFDLVVRDLLEVPSLHGQIGGCPLEDPSQQRPALRGGARESADRVRELPVRLRVLLAERLVLVL